MNTATQSTTEVSPKFLNFGRHSQPVKNLRRSIEMADKPPVVSTDREVWHVRLKLLDYLREFVIKHINKAREKQKESYDVGRKNVWFEVSDSVMRTSHHLSDASRRFSTKLAPRKDEPVEVTKVLSPTVYDVETSDGRQLSKDHVKHLTPYR